MTVDAARLIEARHCLATYFEASLFADPARDILLDLFAAERAGRQLSITSACVGANVPATTALRWISLLEQKGHILRVPDATDGRRMNLILSRGASASIAAYIDDVARILASGKGTPDATR